MKEHTVCVRDLVVVILELATYLAVDVEVGLVGHGCGIAMQSYRI